MDEKPRLVNELVKMVRMKIDEKQIMSALARQEVTVDTT